jgi:PKHD-type hydroxylase
VARLREIASKLNFVDGRASNPNNPTKNNLQASELDPLYGESSRIVADAFLRSGPFQDFAFPRSIVPPLLARYEVGMAYGAHADGAHLSCAGTGCAATWRRRCDWRRLTAMTAASWWCIWARIPWRSRAKPAAW